MSPQFPRMQGTGKYSYSSSGAEFHPLSRKIGLEGKMNCAYMAPGRCLSNQFLKTGQRLHQCPRQPVQVLPYPSHWKATLYPDGSMGLFPYLPVQPHKGGVTCCNTTGDLQSVLKTVLPLGQGGDGERNTAIKPGMQIQMAETHLLPRMNNREVREVSKCRHELSQLV